MAFAAHLLDNDSDLHFTTATDVENVRSLGLLDSNGNIGPNFLNQPLPDVAGGDEFAVDASERAVVDRELHLNGGRIDRHEGQRHAVFGIGDGFADEDVFEAGQADDVAGMSFGDLDSFEAFEVKDRGDFRQCFSPIAVDADRGIAHFYLAAVDFAKSDSAEVIGVIEIGGEQFETFAGVSAGRGNVFDDGVEERFHRAADVLEIELGITLFGAGIDDGEIHLLVGGMKGDEQVPDGIEHFVWIGVLAINFVDDDDWFCAGFEGFAENETGLRLGTVCGIDDEQHAVDHVHDAFDFAAEIGVPRSIDDIDVVILVFESGVFGADGDALFALEIH